jgi:hypothetical protein
VFHQPGNVNGISEIFKPATKDSETISIPLRHDYRYGGFYVDYILPSKNETDFKYQKVLVSARHADYIQSTKLAGDDILLSDDHDIVVATVSSSFDSDAVTEVVFGQHEDFIMRNICGVKTGLRTRKK